MRLATWNLNNRVGKIPFRPEAAHAAVLLGADVLVFTEYFPQHHHAAFSEVLASAGWANQLLSHEPAVTANRVFMASRLPLVRDALPLPTFDHQFPANLLAASLPTYGLTILGVRVPAYRSEQTPLLLKSWEWLEHASARLRETKAVVMGDLNVQASSTRGPAGESFRRILDSGWQRAAPASGYSFLGHTGKCSVIDHLLTTQHCRHLAAEYVTSVPGFTLAGEADAISDHAALVVDLEMY